MNSLCWTKKKPTVSGWYWRREDAKDPRYDVIVRVTDTFFPPNHDGKGMYIYVPNIGYWPLPEGGLWSGPVEVPLPIKFKKKKRKKRKNEN